MYYNSSSKLNIKDHFVKTKRKKMVEVSNQEKKLNICWYSPQRNIPFPMYRNWPNETFNFNTLVW